MKFLPGLDGRLYAAFSGAWVGAVDVATGSGGTMTALSGVGAAVPYTLDYLEGSLLVGTGAGVYRAAALAGPWSLISSVPTFGAVRDGSALVFLGNDSSVYSTTDGLSLTGAVFNGGPAMSAVAFQGFVPYGSKYLSW